MQDHERTIVWLALMGALIGLGKLLVSDEVLTWRIVIGRTIIGAATSTAALAALSYFTDLPSSAIYGLGSVLGIAGAQVLEKLLLAWGARTNP